MFDFKMIANIRAFFLFVYKFIQFAWSKYGEDKKCMRNKSLLEMEKKVEEVNEMIQQSVDKCLSKGLQPDEIWEILETQLIGPRNRRKSVARFVLFSKISVAVAMIATLVALIDPLSRASAMLGRKLLIEIQPYWDWSDYYETRCFLRNPYYVPPKPLKSNSCQMCEDMKAIERRTESVSPEIVAHYIQNEVPLIVDRSLAEDELKLWPIYSHPKLSEKLLTIYGEVNEKVCMLRTNLKVRDHYELLQHVNQSADTKWFSHWENCYKETRKAFRLLYSRPSFLPPMVETTRSNWILMSSNKYEAKTWKKIEPGTGTRVMLMVQVKGANDIRLEPQEVCFALGCDPMTERLEAGDTLIYNTLLWRLEYLPEPSEQFNVALLVDGYFG